VTAAETGSERGARAAGAKAARGFGYHESTQKIFSMPRLRSLGLLFRAELLFAVFGGLALVAAGCSTTGHDPSASDASSTDRDSTLASAAEQIVAAHNAVRAQVIEPPNYQGTWSALPPVKWSEQVAASAQGWADHLRDTAQCGLRHDTGSRYGENLAAGTHLTPTAAVDMWASEKSAYTYDPRYEFVAGHYTQIVWRSSVEIGCGAASCNNQTVIVCRYDPPGNVIGQQPY
jgi:pathogenesis-related protein 1